MSTILLRNLILAPFDDQHRVWPEADLLMRDNRIAAIASSISQETDQVLDCTGCIALPGLINTHHHLSQTLTRCLPSVQNCELFDWLVAQYPIWGRITDEMLYVGTQVGLAELLLSGCTTTSDLTYVFPPGSDVRLDTVIRAARDIGIRLHAGRGSMSLGQSRGGLPPDHIVQDEDTILDDTERLVNAYHDPQEGAMVRIDVAPCSPFSVTPELLRQSRELARRRSLLCQTHLAETRDEERYCLEKFGKRPLAFMEEQGWLGSDVYYAHGIHFDPAEIRRLGSTRTGIAHCPSSNMRLGSGIAPVLDLLESGARIGLGVDGSASNDGGNLLLEARMAMLLGRLRYGMRYAAQMALEVGTRGGASVLGRAELGSLEEGKMADIAVFDLNRVEYAGASQWDPLAALVFCQPTPPRYLFVNGRLLVRDGRLLTIDLPVVVQKHNRFARQLADAL